MDTLNEDLVKDKKLDTYADGLESYFRDYNLTTPDYTIGDSGKMICVFREGISKDGKIKLNYHRVRKSFFGLNQEKIEDFLAIPYFCSANQTLNLSSRESGSGNLERPLFVFNYPCLNRKIKKDNPFGALQIRVLASNPLEQMRIFLRMYEDLGNAGYIYQGEVVERFSNRLPELSLVLLGHPLSHDQEIKSIIGFAEKTILGEK